MILLFMHHLHAEEVIFMQILHEISANLIWN